MGMAAATAVIQANRDLLIWIVFCSFEQPFVRPVYLPLMCTQERYMDNLTEKQNGIRQRIGNKKHDLKLNNRNYLLHLKKIITILRACLDNCNHISLAHITQLKDLIRHSKMSDKCHFQKPATVSCGIWSTSLVPAAESTMLTPFILSALLLSGLTPHDYPKSQPAKKEEGKN